MCSLCKSPLCVSLGLLFLFTLSTASTSVADDPPEAFPAASPQATQTPPEAVQLLADLIKQLVEDEAVVGGEIHVIKNRKTILHESFGWADRDEKRKLRKDSVHCVRSMTKPLTGTAIQMLLDEGKLKLDTPVFEYAPAFDTPPLRGVTVQHLLRHTSGLPFSAISRPLADYDSLAEVAADAAKAGLAFRPGEKFQYSDAGSDTLGAAIEAISNTTADKFIERRILKPIDMNQSITLLTAAAPKERIPSAYSGGPRSWERHWRPSDPPIFPLFLTSQSLYSTTTDYAKFLAMWMDRGLDGERRLLSENAVTQALAPGRSIGAPSGFKKLKVTYGSQWTLYHDAENKLVAFGHNGSDGTHAWAFPNHDLIVLYFTQSRGTTSGIQVEDAIDRLLLRNEVDAFRRDMESQVARTALLQRCEGIYWDQDVDSAYYVVRADGKDLVVERPGRFRAVVLPRAKAGEFSFGLGSVQFELDDDGGKAAAMKLITLARTERQVRHQPPAALPSADAILARVKDAHRFDKLATKGVVHFRGKVKMGPFGRRGEIEQWFDERSFRVDLTIGGSTTSVIIDGQLAAATSANGNLKRLDGPRLEQSLVAHPYVQFADWRRGYRRLQVLKSLSEGESKQWLVRVVADKTPGASLLVDQDSGRVIGEQRLEYVAGAGYIGQQSQYSDFRDVDGALMPFRTESSYANPLIGKITIQFDSVETGVERGKLFELPTPE